LFCVDASKLKVPVLADESLTVLLAVFVQPVVAVFTPQSPFLRMNAAPVEPLPRPGFASNIVGVHIPLPSLSVIFLISTVPGTYVPVGVV
jgi:hypothetical protein